GELPAVTPAAQREETTYGQDGEGTVAQCGGARRAHAADGGRARAEEDARGGPQPRPRHPRPDPGPDLRGTDHLRADVREALRDRREPADLPAAGRRDALVLGRGQGRERHAAVP